MKNVIWKCSGGLCALALALALLAGCAEGEEGIPLYMRTTASGETTLSEKQYAALKEKRGVLDEADFDADSMELSITEGYVFQLTDSGRIAAPHNTYYIFHPLVWQGAVQENELLQQIYALCKDLKAKEPEAYSERMLPETPGEARIAYPTLYFTCRSAGYVYVLDFYAPADPENLQNDWSAQVEYGLGEEVVVEVSKLPLASGGTTADYGSAYSRELNLWTLLYDDQDYRGRPWVSTLPRENFEQILALVEQVKQQQGVSVTLIEGEGNWQALPTFEKLYNTYSLHLDSTGREQ